VKTDELIAMLSAEPSPVPRRAAARRIGSSLALGTGAALVLMLATLGVRPDWQQAMGWPMFWVKLAFPLAVAAAGFVATERLARPGVEIGGAWIGVALSVVVLWLLALAVWLGAAGDERAGLVWGSTWRTCAATIGLMAVPVFVASMVALRGLAPTQSAMAGAAAGALAGGAGAAVYALHCPELAAPFLAVWYVAGMALPVLAGAALGPLLLRW